MRRKLTPVEVATNFINKRNICDPDLIQDIYLLALEKSGEEFFTQRFNSKAFEILRNNHHDTEIPYGTIRPYECIRTNLSLKTKSVIHNVLKNKRYTDIIILYFNNNESMSEIGERYGITTSRVSQIINKAIRRIRHNQKSRAKVVCSLSVRAQDIYFD